MSWLNQNRTIESAEIINELIEIAKKIQEDHQKGMDLWLNEEEVVFYDALVMNESALRNEQWNTKKVSRKLVKLVRENATIDRTVKEDVQAKLRLYIKRLLKKYKYPPDLEEWVTDIILRQAKITADEIA